jgi:hypothetical protein
LLYQLVNTDPPPPFHPEFPTVSCHLKLGSAKYSHNHAGRAGNSTGSSAERAGSSAGRAGSSTGRGGNEMVTTSRHQTCFKINIKIPIAVQTRALIFDVNNKKHPKSFIKTDNNEAAAMSFL